MGWAASRTLCGNFSTAASSMAAGSPHSARPAISQWARSGTRQPSTSYTCVTVSAWPHGRSCTRSWQQGTTCQRFPSQTATPVQQQQLLQHHRTHASPRNNSSTSLLQQGLLQPAPGQQRQARPAWTPWQLTYRTNWRTSQPRAQFSASSQEPAPAAATLHLHLSSADAGHAEHARLTPSAQPVRPGRPTTLQLQAATLLRRWPLHNSTATHSVTRHSSSWTACARADGAAGAHWAASTASSGRIGPPDRTRASHQAWPQCPPCTPSCAARSRQQKQLLLLQRRQRPRRPRSGGAASLAAPQQGDGSSRSRHGRHPC